MKTIIFALIFTIFLSPFQLFSKKIKRPPYYLKKMCPYECCGFGHWVAREELKVYKSEKYKNIAFNIKKNEHVTLITGNIIIIQHGIKLIDHDFIYKGQKIRKGDKLYLLSYLGEGRYLEWLNGIMEEDIESSMKGTPKLIQDLKFYWSVKVKNKKGKIGWLKLYNTAGMMGFSVKEKIYKYPPGC